MNQNVNLKFFATPKEKTLYRVVQPLNIKPLINDEKFKLLESLDFSIKAITETQDQLFKGFNMGDIINNDYCIFETTDIEQLHIFIIETFQESYNNGFIPLPFLNEIIEIDPLDTDDFDDLITRTANLTCGKIYIEKIYY